VRDSYSAVLIRLADIAIAFLGVTLTFPLIVTVCFLIWVIDLDNPIYCQKRLGRNMRVFRIYKLRTMKVGTPTLPTHRIEGDQITRFGHYLRLLKIDELPQFWNVLRGDMSLVGARPCLLSQHELINLRSAANVFSLRPGLTGLAQIEGVDMARPHDLVKLEVRWTDRPNLRNYCWILIRSFVYIVSRTRSD